MGKGEKGFQPGNTCGAAHRFTRENQPKTRGRKKLIYKKVLGDPKNCLSVEEFRNVLRALLEMSLTDLEKIVETANSSGVPAWIIVVVKAMLSDIKKGRIYVLSFLMNQIFGKVTEKVVFENLATTEENFDLSVLTEEELKQFNRLVEKVISQPRSLQAASTKNSDTIDLSL